MLRNKMALVLLTMICIMAVGLAGYAHEVVEGTGSLKYAMHFGIGGGIYPDIHKVGKEKMYGVTMELDKLGMIWLRHPGRGTSWREIQPTRGTWDFGKLDAVLKNNDHPWIFFVYAAVGSAYPFNANFSKKYMRSLGSRKEILNHIISNTVDMNDPQQRADAELYVKTLVNRYKDKVKYWEIRNEGISAPNAFDITKYTYKWIKEADPEATVLVLAIAGDGDPKYRKGLRAFDSLLAKGMGDYFDIANFHYYGTIDGDFDKRLEERYDEYKAILDKYGIKKPIWVTETGTSSYENSLLSGKSSKQRQARDMVKRLVIFSAKGAEKVIWFNYKQTRKKDKFYGCNIIGHGIGPKPAYYTFKLLVEKIGYYKTVEMLRRDSVRLYKFTADKPIFVAWSNSPEIIDLSKYIGAFEVLVTHIIEDKNIQPKTKIAKTSSVSVSASPIFIEFVE